MEEVHQDELKYVSNSALFYRSETFIIKIEAAIETDQVTIKSQPSLIIYQWKFLNRKMLDSDWSTVLFTHNFRETRKNRLLIGRRHALDIYVITKGIPKMFKALLRDFLWDILVIPSQHTYSRNILAFSSQIFLQFWLNFGSQHVHVSKNLFPKLWFQVPSEKVFCATHINLGCACLPKMYLDNPWVV